MGGSPPEDAEDGGMVRMVRMALLEKWVVSLFDDPWRVEVVPVMEMGSWSPSVLHSRQSVKPSDFAAKVLPVQDVSRSTSQACGAAGSVP